MRFKTVWVSDIHLGSQGCRAQDFIDFLDEVKYDTLIMNGDIIDGWRLKSKWYFPQEHVNAIRKVLSAAKHGKNIIYVTGNHDEFLRGYHEFNLNLGNIQVVNKYVHTAVDGDEYLVVHGDGFDGIMNYHKWLAHIGDLAYVMLLQANVWWNRVRKWFGYDYWSISKYLKHRVKEAANFMFKFEETAAKATCGRFTGVICGHIHHPEIKIIGDNTLYLNSGDWVENCSWLAETYDGTFQIWEWNNGTPILLKEYNKNVQEVSNGHQEEEN